MVEVLAVRAKHLTKLNLVSSFWHASSLSVMKAPPVSLSVVIVVSLMSAACFRTIPVSQSRCWDGAGALFALRAEAKFGLSEREGTEADRVRALAGVGRDTLRIQKQLRVVTDDAICASAGAAFGHLNSNARFAVVQLGHAYWLRSDAASGALVLDDHFVTVMRIVDLW